MYKVPDNNYIFLTNYILLNFLSYDVSKAISFLFGAIVAFIMNKYWTFENYEKSYKEVLQFGVLYGISLTANVVANKLVLEYTSLILLAFLVATGISMTLNFLGQKFFVFK